MVMIESEMDSRLSAFCRLFVRYGRMYQALSGQRQTYDLPSGERRQAAITNMDRAMRRLLDRGYNPLVAIKYEYARYLLQRPSEPMKLKQLVRCVGDPQAMQQESDATALCQLQSDLQRLATARMDAAICYGDEPGLEEVGMLALPTIAGDVLTASILHELGGRDAVEPDQHDAAVTEYLANPTVYRVIRSSYVRKYLDTLPGYAELMRSSR